MRLTLRGTFAALKAAATLRRLRLPFSEIERRRRGFVILQIDALSHDDVLSAMGNGYMPHLKRLLEGTHSLTRWRSGAPSDTAAIQCSLMYGRKSNVPGFYWFDRRRNRPVICSWPIDMAAVEEENAGGRPGLFRHGAVYTGMAAGGAPRAVLTTSALGRTRFPPRLTGIDVFLLLALNPWRLARAAVLTVAEVAIEIRQVFAARIRGGYVAPEGIFPLTRAFTHVLFRELTTLGIRLDIFRGVPSIYANYIGYDEVAHHFGPRSRPAYKALKALDRQIRDVHRAIERIALRPYDLYIISDHGMTPSLPFRRVYGHTLGQFIAAHGVGPAPTRELDTRPLRDMATLQQVDQLSADLGPRTNSVMSFVVDRATRLAMRVGTGPLQAGLADGSEHPVLAIYSSALANVYFTDMTERPDRSQIEARAPGLVTSLATHPGVGMVIVKSETGHAIVHARGTFELETPGDSGCSFLGEFDDPDIVRRHLLSLARMPCAGDLLVFGAYDGETVINFEDHGGAHGGLGGVQMFPFLAAPRYVAPDFSSVEDATDLHPLFANRYQSKERRGAANGSPDG